MSGYGNIVQRPTSLYFGGNGPVGGINGNSTGVSSNSNNNDVFVDDQEDQIVPDCSAKIDLSPGNEQEVWVGGNSDADAGGCHHAFLTTAVHLSLQEVNHKAARPSIIHCIDYRHWHDHSTRSSIQLACKSPDNQFSFEIIFKMDIAGILYYASINLVSIIAALFIV